MKFELKTDNEPFPKYWYYLFSVFLIISLIIAITNIASKLGNISRHYEITYLCRLLKVEKSSFDFKKLSKLTNQKNKQKIWDLCSEIVRYQLDADVQYLNANIQNFLDVNKKMPEIITSRNIFHKLATPRNTSDGIVVINAIGRKTLKNIFR